MFYNETLLSSLKAAAALWHDLFLGEGCWKARDFGWDSALLHDLVEQNFSLHIIARQTAVDYLSFWLVAGWVGVGWAGWNGVLGEADLGHLFNHFGSGDWFGFVSSLASRALSGILSSSQLFFAVVALAVIITAVFLALVLFFAVRIAAAFLVVLVSSLFAVRIAAAFIVVLVSSLFAVLFAAAGIVIFQFHSALLLLIFTLALLVVRRSAVFALGGGADLVQVSWIFTAFFLNGVFLVERSDVRLKLEFGVSEFVGGLKVVVSAETTLNISEEWAHLDVDGVTIEVDTDVRFGEDDLDVLARFLNLSNLSVLAHDGLRVTDVLLYSIDPDLD